MRYWYDCEFLENGRTIELISIGMVAEDGRELYLVNEAAGEGELRTGIRNNPWLMRHVVPHLPLRGGKIYSLPSAGDAFDLDWTSNVVVPLRYIRNAVRDFIAAAGPDRDEHELWAHYGAYDHVALCQLFGRMIDLPECVPMRTRDIMDLPDVQAAIAAVPQQQEHHALADARWNRDVYREWEQV